VCGESSRQDSIALVDKKRFAPEQFRVNIDSSLELFSRLKFFN